MNHSIGKQIAKRRKDLRMTQETVANLTEISENQISNLENNHCVPTVETILKLSKALKVTPDYFYWVQNKEKAQRTELLPILRKSHCCVQKNSKNLSASLYCC
ncbi:MAG: helix-turn-helix domain-containing protein [Defluviitaleaceae bacterium]|nr:helix-turn-helix domain-containing protein [Defluviitaleaceae bacterium]